MLHLCININNHVRKKSDPFRNGHGRRKDNQVAPSPLATFRRTLKLPLRCRARANLRRVHFGRAVRQQNRSEALACRSRRNEKVKQVKFRDTIASILLFVIGFGIIWHLHQLDTKQLSELKDLNEARWSRPVTLPEGLKNNIKKSYAIRD